MAFKSVQITGNGTEHVVLTNTSVLEGVVTGGILYNSTGLDLSFTISIDNSVAISETVSANSSYRLIDKINVPVGLVLTATLPSGLDMTISLYQSAIDTGSALTQTQQYAQNASDDADRAENALPAGTIDDGSVSTTKAWSASKILQEIGNNVSRNYVTVSDNYVSYAKDFIYLDTTVNGEFAVTLPSAPSTNDTIGFLDIMGNLSNNSIIVSRNGNTIMGRNRRYDNRYRQY